MKIKKLLCLGLLGTTALTGCATGIGDSWYKTDTEKALLYWTVGDFNSAIQSAYHALQDNPKDPYALMVSGYSYDALGYPNQSRRYYEDLLRSEATEKGIFFAVKNMQPEPLKKAAAIRLEMQEMKNRPYTEVLPDTNLNKFNDYALNQHVTTQNGDRVTLAKSEMKGGLDMLTEADRNVVDRFLIFTRLRDEKYVTKEEWENRRTVNLGGLLPYSLTPAGLGLNLPSPGGDVIIQRLNQLRYALEMRAITPREHATEREIILEALLPSNPSKRMMPTPPPQDVLEGATALRRIETLQRVGLITPKEAESEKKAIEKLIYAKLGMSDGGEANPSAAKCIRSCLAEPAPKCPAAKPAVKKKIKKKAKPVVNACSCPAATTETNDKK